MSEPLNEEEFATLIRLAKRVLWSDRDTRRKLQAEKLHITPVNFYATIPSIADIENSFEFRESERLQGPYSSPSVFDKNRAKEFLSNLDQYADEFDPPLSGDNDSPDAFFWENSAFSFMDAMSYYCVLRHFKPNRVLEVGSGFSTLVADMAMQKNGTGELVLIEPFPRPFLSGINSVHEIIESVVQDIEVSELIALVESADIWFIDSTHTVKVGSDCLYIYLKVMPEIHRNIIVHSHDVALPYALPASKTERHIYWTEQYLLYAYLLDNPKARVLTGSNYIQKQLPELSRQLMRNRFGDGGGSIWYELNG